MSTNIKLINKLRNLLKNYPTIYKFMRRLYASCRKSLRRGEVRRLLHWMSHGHFIRQILVRRFLKNNSQRKLQVGGWIHNIEDDGWLNGDIIAGDIYIDATKSLPFPDESFHYIFTEHFLEHLTFSEARHFLKETHRILRKDGVLRLSTPDLDGLIKLYYDDNSFVTLENAMERHRLQHNLALSTRCEFLNDVFRKWGHKFIYDEETLRKILEDSGFTNIQRCKYGQSVHDDLNGRERHAENYEWMKSAFIIINEAQKP